MATALYQKYVTVSLCKSTLAIASYVAIIQNIYVNILFAFFERKTIADLCMYLWLIQWVTITKIAATKATVHALITIRIDNASVYVASFLDNNY